MKKVNVPPGPARVVRVLGTMLSDRELTARVTVPSSGAPVESNCDADALRAWWGVARRHLHPDKAIRWRIVARTTPDFGDEVTDLAPDAGWYV